MNKAYDNFIKLAMKENLQNSSDFLRLKKKLSGILKVPVPTNADLREHYEKMIKIKKIKRDSYFENVLKSKIIRTQSGVAVVAVLTKPYPCPGKCIYCPNEKNMPKSYLSNEPAVMRAIDARFNPYRQVQNRLRALELNGHNLSKIEIIVMGGTFSYLPKNYQTKFITECFRACNEYASQKIRKSKKTLEEEQKKNENSRVRIIGLTLETRPDYINAYEIRNFRRLGCTRVELGVQSIFDDVLEINQRGHLISETIRATKLLKDAGFKINYHIMPGLPGSNLKKDFEMFKQLFSNPDFQPDMLKIYPTVVTRGTKLFTMWKKGEYKPLPDEAFKKFVLKIKKEVIPPYVRIQRLVRDVPTSEILAGPIVSNLRQIIEKESECQCIRCREVKNTFEKNEKLVVDRIDYLASNGQEIFLQFVSQNKQRLFAMLRLRIPSDKNSVALIREVHTYGNLTPVNRQDERSPQHIGLGKKLIQEAEDIAKKEFGAQKISVISGIGVRAYYRKLGYRLEKTYMVKYL